MMFKKILLSVCAVTLLASNVYAGENEPVFITQFDDVADTTGLIWFFPGGGFNGSPGFTIGSEMLLIGSPSTNGAVDVTGRLMNARPEDAVQGASVTTFGTRWDIFNDIQGGTDYEVICGAANGALIDCWRRNGNTLRSTFGNTNRKEARQCKKNVKKIATVGDLAKRSGRKVRRKFCKR